jgi:hypothetical protein
MRKNRDSHIKQLALRKAKKLRAWLRAREEALLGPRQPEWRSW